MADQFQVYVRGPAQELLDQGVNLLVQHYLTLNNILVHLLTTFGENMNGLYSSLVKAVLPEQIQNALAYLHNTVYIIAPVMALFMATVFVVTWRRRQSVKRALMAVFGSFLAILLLENVLEVFTGNRAFVEILTGLTFVSGVEAYPVPGFVVRTAFLNDNVLNLAVALVAGLVTYPVADFVIAALNGHGGDEDPDTQDFGGWLGVLDDATVGSVSIVADLYEDYKLGLGSLSFFWQFLTLGINGLLLSPMQALVSTVITTKMMSIPTTRTKSLLSTGLAVVITSFFTKLLPDMSSTTLATAALFFISLFYILPLQDLLGMRNSRIKSTRNQRFFGVSVPRPARQGGWCGMLLDVVLSPEQAYLRFARDVFVLCTSLGVLVSLATYGMLLMDASYPQVTKSLTSVFGDQLPCSIESVRRAVVGVSDPSTHLVFPVWSPFTWIIELWSNMGDVLTWSQALNLPVTGFDGICIV